MDKRFVDLHTHILPGVDDGAKDMDTAIEMLRMAWDNGTGTVVLTPHYRGRYKKTTPREMRAVFEELSNRAAKEVPDMKLILGHEAGNEHELWDKLLCERVLTLGGTRYVLLEFEEHCYRSNVLSSVLSLVNSGFLPVIAHVERYEIFRKTPSLAAEVVSMGAMLQVNAGSILGKHGLGVSLYCRKLLRKGLVSFVASDAHDPKDRTPALRACYDRVRTLRGEAVAQAVFAENAQRILSETEAY